MDDGHVRKRIEARVSAEGQEGWKRAAAQHHLRLSSLLDAVGQALADGTLRLPAEVVERAVELEEENFRRT